jgi:hypothetical protein
MGNGSYWSKQPGSVLGRDLSMATSTGATNVSQLTTNAGSQTRQVRI